MYPVSLTVVFGPLGEQCCNHLSKYLTYAVLSLIWKKIIQIKWDHEVFFWFILPHLSPFLTNSNLFDPGRHTVCLSQSVLLSGLLLLYLFLCFFYFWFNSIFAFPCQSPVFILSFFFPEIQYIQFDLYFSASSTCASWCHLRCFPPYSPSLSLNVSLNLCCWFSFFHSSHPLFISPLFFLSFLGSLLTLLNVRAQTSPCRAAPSHRGQKQLVSLPLPCFLAASVCLSVCLLASAPVIPFTLHSLSVAGWSLVLPETCLRQSFSTGRTKLNSTCRVLALQIVDLNWCDLEQL